MNGLSLHRCPTKLYKKWETCINRKDFNVTKCTRVCSNHFPDGKPTEKNPLPCLFMKDCTTIKERRKIVKYTEPQRKKRRGDKIELIDHVYYAPDISALSSSEVDPVVVTIDHNYHASSSGTSTISDMQSQKDHCIPVIQNPSDHIIPVIQSRSDHSIPVIQSPSDHIIPVIQSRSNHSIPVIQSPSDHNISVIQSPSDHNISATQSISEELSASVELENIDIATPINIPLDIDHIRHRDELFKVYTGITNYSKFQWIFNTIHHNIPHLRIFKSNADSSSSTSRYYQEHITKKPGPSRKLSPQNELLLTLMKIKMDLLHEDLAFRFGISVSLVSQILSTWIPLLSRELHGLIYWPTQEEISLYYPECFLKFPRVRAIIDCTEIPLQRPSIAKANSQIYSNYKSRPTAKVLVACTPGGTVSFISKSAGGAMTDKKLVMLSGILEKFEPLDVCLADRGFNIQELLAPYQVKLIIPPFLKKNQQFDTKDCIKTKQVANARIHVERVIGRLKEFQILKGDFPLDMLDLLDDILVVCGVLVNLQPPLVPL